MSGLKYIDYGGTYARKGDWVTCENGHIICVFNRNVIIGGAFDGAALEMWQQREPTIGQADMPVCAVCQAPFVRNLNEFHFYDGWRVLRPAFFGPYGYWRKLWQAVTGW